MCRGLTGSDTGSNIPHVSSIIRLIINTMKNPTRRNRNIGTAKFGHGQSNKMKIPTSRYDQHGIDTLFHERVKPDHLSHHVIGENKITVLYEKPRDGWSYGCSPSDVLFLYSIIQEEIGDIPGLLVFRQPTKKQSNLQPVWGRLDYVSVIGGFIEPTIYLEALNIGHKRWPKPKSLEDQEEHNRLIADGHEFTEHKRYFSSFCSDENIRSTMLYRTLLHELGHWHEYDSIYDKMHAISEQELDDEIDHHHAKPVREREHYAHQFAEKLTAKLRASGKIPFDPLPFQC